MTAVYGVYALFAVLLTVFLARTLSENGALLLADVFADNPALAKAVNRLLVVGFYLVNFGYACLLLKGGNATSLSDASAWRESRSLKAVTSASMIRPCSAETAVDGIVVFG